jgi:hypothetical protein
MTWAARPPRRGHRDRRNDLEGLGTLCSNPNPIR